MNATNITNLIDKAEYITVDVNYRHFVGSYYMIGDIKAVNYLREVNSTKQTTNRIICAVTIKLNK